MVEAVVVIPFAMLILFVAVQMALWAVASSLVQSAASFGEESAISLGGSPAAGVTRAESELAVTARAVVQHPSVTASVAGGGVVTIRVSGTAESIIPLLSLPVSATRTGLVQEFRESG
jgi:hypothetical protein